MHRQAEDAFECLRICIFYAIRKEKFIYISTQTTQQNQFDFYVQYSRYDVVPGTCYIVTIQNCRFITASFLHIFFFLLEHFAFISHGETSRYNVSFETSCANKTHIRQIRTDRFRAICNRVNSERSARMFFLFYTSKQNETKWNLVRIRCARGCSIKSQLFQERGTC